jgi:putative colanic acid biosynthesis acetyltransferase WcaF
MSSREHANQSVIDLSRAAGARDIRNRSRFVQALWGLSELVFLYNPLIPSSGPRRFILKIFGARIGRHVKIRARVRVKYPWKLSVGENSWLGEGVWIDNHDRVDIGSNAVVSQETYITTGSHSYRTDMHLITSPVLIRDGVWLCARTLIMRGVTIGTNSIVTPGSIVSKSIGSGEIHGGNPAQFIRHRAIQDRGRT